MPRGVVAKEGGFRIAGLRLPRCLYLESQVPRNIGPLCHTLARNSRNATHNSEKVAPSSVKVAQNSLKVTHNCRPLAFQVVRGDSSSQTTGSPSNYAAADGRVSVNWPSCDPTRLGTTLYGPYNSPYIFPLGLPDIYR